MPSIGPEVASLSFIALARIQEYRTTPAPAMALLEPSGAHIAITNPREIDLAIQIKVVDLALSLLPVKAA